MRRSGTIANLQSLITREKMKSGSQAGKRHYFKYLNNTVINERLTNDDT